MHKLFETSYLASTNVDTVLNFGARLDTRPYRLSLLSSMHWIDVDLPDELADKKRQLQCAKPIYSLEKVGLDPPDTARRNSLFTVVNAIANQILVIIEGRLSYFPEAQIRSRTKGKRQQASVCWWILAIVSAFSLQPLRACYGQRLFNQYFREETIIAFLFAPENGIEFLQASGWRTDQVRSI